MNLFSQSKLTLKLKKQNSNSTLSTDPTNKSQDLTPSNAVISECNNVLNNSVLSENDSFVEVLHTVRPQDEKVTMSQNVFKTSAVKNTSDVITKSKQCPVCLQTIDFKHFIIHVKTCGTSHNLSTEVLMKAVDLQERQAAEREALGLPKLSKSSDSKIKKKCNKQTKLKIGSDSNFDLAVAMSMSLQESKEAEIIKESENLLEAGLETEAIEKRKTLESFGFVSNQPIKSKSKNFYKTNSLLFKQTQEDRQKRITEKVAMILIDCDTDTSSKIFLNDCSNIQLRSKYLNKIRDIDCKLWKKTLLEENSVSEFYVKNMSKFLSPIEGNGLQNNVLFLTHKNTSKQESNTTNQKVINTSHTVLDDSKVHIKNFTHRNIIGNKTMSEYSSRWKSMLGSQFMSDITIFSKDEHEIPAHILVFHVQCPDILNDIITEESDTCKSKKMVMWSEYTYEACMAFLELIYSGQEQLISPEYRKDYLQLVTRYNVQIAINDDDGKHGWFSVEQNKVSKRKSSDLCSIESKRHKTLSPDMFMVDDTSEEISNINSNFLGTTVNDEKSLSMLKTKQWLENCNLSQHHNSSFTEKSEINVLSQINSSPAHSFHSASTIYIPLTPTSNLVDYTMDFENNDVQISSSLDVRSASPKSLSTDESSVKAILMLSKVKKVPIDLKSSSNKISTITNSRKEPEIITIFSDSDNESIDMVLSLNNSSLRDRNINLLNENNCTPFLASINEKKNYFSLNSINKSNDISVIELNDSSLDSIHSISTNVLHQKNCDSKLDNVSINKSTISTPRTKTLIKIDEEETAVSTVTKFTNSSSTQIPSSNFNNFIDLIYDSSSDSITTIDKMPNNNSMPSFSLNNTLQNSSTPFSNVLRKINSPTHNSLPTQFEINNCVSNATPLKEGNTWSAFSFPVIDGDYHPNINTKTNEDFCSSNFSSYTTLPKCSDSKLLPTEKLFQYNVMSSTFLNTASCTQINNIENNDNIIKNEYSNEKIVLNKPSSDLEPLENIVSKKNVISSNNHVNSLVKEVVDLSTISSSSQYTHTSFTPYSSQVETVKLPIIPEITTSNEKDYGNNESVFEQIIDDPWMDYNDWEPVNISPLNVSPVLLEKNSMVLVNDSEVLTPPKKMMSHINMDLKTSPLNISSNIDAVNHQMTNSVTPNKYGSRINTPKSLRRVQSESIIGTNEQITPLPNYSTMKTPDLRKEFDRYGLKDLGRRKGKLILRHIYDLTHSIHSSKEANSIGESEQFSDSSDSSEPEISYYETGAYDELETFSQTNLSNKTSVDMGFKDLLRVNEELHKKILCYEPIWIEELKEDLKQYNVNISMQKLMTFLDDKCVSFRSKSLNDQRKKSLAKKNTKRKKLF
ncbi:structure-specific endonuclease subunit SLX4-like [Melanaphis sacchari]|uniref:structure-specific endonuclease subunit SLX4-like n=1 Tax=Melanaphis sacchari TaxID=742174 RepID=UPI000DC12CDF|nr:structure-specific endonuclease subunit SLX4-like [Melanaphis sacchari]